MIRMSQGNWGLIMDKGEKLANFMQGFAATHRCDLRRKGFGAQSVSAQKASARESVDG